LFAHGPADGTAIPKLHHLLLHLISTSSKSRPVLPFWHRLTQVVLEKKPLNGRSLRQSSHQQNNKYQSHSFHISTFQCYIQLAPVTNYKSPIHGGNNESKVYGYSSSQATCLTATGTHMPHMGSHSVTCHPAEVTFTPLLQPKLVLD